jgi:hypothetical protein
MLAITAGVAFLTAELVLMPFILAHVTNEVSAKRATTGLGGMTLIAIVAVIVGVASLLDRRNAN